MFSDLGVSLERICTNAKKEIVLVAPFIKYKSLQRLISTNNNINIKCVTRWRPDEIAMGVSDIDIWLLLCDRPNASLWLRPDLHAKYYRADDQCMIGSANLTDTALGWSKQPNLELLLHITAVELSSFEDELLRGCVEVDDDLYNHMKSVVGNLDVTKLERLSELEKYQEEYADEIDVVAPEAWLPILRHPEKLYSAYKGKLDELGIGSRIAAISDLQALDIPLGFSESDFNEYVGMILLQKPIIQRIDQFVSQPQRFGAVRDLLSKAKCAEIIDFDATIAWQTTMRWLLHFGQDRYNAYKQNHSEIFHRKFE